MSALSSRGLQCGLRLLSQGSHRRFLMDLRTPRHAQQELLKQLLLQHSRTDYGRQMRIDPSMSEDEFRERIPLTSFEQPEFREWIERQRQAPERAIIAPGEVRLFEKTSGSSGTQKLIPYNSELLASFERYFRVWLHDLLRCGPTLRSLRVFMSVSPSFRSDSEVQQKIGFEDDTQYLSPILRAVMRRFLSVPLDLKFIRDPDDFRDLLCAYLASDQDLEVISIWHPSLFLVLWEHLASRRERIADLIEGKARIQERAIPKSPLSIDLLRGRSPLSTRELWPRLRFVSAWESAGSALSAHALRELLPHASFQGKGLLATEAPMTLPLLGPDGQSTPYPFLNDVLFEFRDESGRYHWIDELENNREYSLVISQRGGFLRYDMRDRVLARRSDLHPTPSLEFIGRDQDSCDLVGEKLSASYLVSHEREFSRRFHSSTYLFVPLSGSKRASYLVLMDTPDDSSAGESGAAAWWEDRLQGAYHYSYARRLGQLGAVRAVRVASFRRKLLDYYVRERGMKAGDVKLRPLLQSPEEGQRLLRYLDAPSQEATLS